MKFKISILCPIANVADILPNHTAIISKNKNYTYRDIHILIVNIQSYLRKKGVKEGTIVSWVTENKLIDILIFWALLRESAIANPLSKRFTEKELERILESTHTTHIITSKLKSKNRILIDNNILDQIIRNLKKVPINIQPSILFLNKISNFIMTSGTTRDPKIIVHDLKNHYFNALNANKNLNVTKSTKWIWSLPQSHVSGLSILFRVFFGKASLLISDEPLEKSLEKNECTHISMVPTQLIRLLNSQSSKWQNSIQTLLLGGTPLPTNLEKKLKELPFHSYISYGLSECASQVQIKDIKNPKKHLESHAQFKINKKNQIMIKSPCIFRGYLQNNKQIKLTTEKDNWFTTEDQGRLEPTGHITILGRTDNMFISGGENIQPEEIEEILNSIEEVQKAIVIEKKDCEFGERPIAFIEPLTDKLIEEIKTIMAKKLSKFKHPIAYYSWPKEIQSSDKKNRHHIKEWFKLNN